MARVEYHSSTSSYPTVILDGGDFAELKARHGRNTELCVLFIRSYIALLSDSPLGWKPIRIYRHFLRDLILDLRLIIRSYSTLADALLQSCSMHTEDTITGDFIEGMINTPIASEYYRFRSTRDPELLRYILSFLYFGKKMVYDDVQLQADALRDWLDIERELNELTIDETKIRRLKAVVRQLIDVKLFDDGLLLPKFGPGYVSEGLIDPSAKFEQLRLDQRLVYTFRPERFLTRREQGGTYAELIQRSLGNKEPAKLKFVPKSYKAVRSICMEPNAYMYFQQTVARWVVEMMDKSIIRWFVDLTDQRPNQRYALAGSFTYSCDTIDLAAASDRLHVDIVRRIFPPRILYYLLGTRSSMVQTPNGLVTVKKFAPMGSSLCFPIQTIVFTAIVLMSYLEDYSATKTLDWDRFSLKRFIKEKIHFCPENVLLNKYIAPRVFGDDIICDSRVTDSVIQNLEIFGLSVNKSKSFMGSANVRESCGIYAYEGEDITPRIFRIKEGSAVSGSFYSSIVSSANLFGDAGYRSVRSVLIRELRRRLKETRLNTDLIYFTENRNDPGIWTSYCYPPKRVRYHMDYQREEREVLMVTSKDPGPEIDQLYAYDLYWISRLRDNSTGFFEPVSRRRPRAVGVKRSWIPL